MLEIGYSILRRLMRPWTLWRFRHDNAEFVVMWRNRLPLVALLLASVMELISPARVWRMLLVAFATVTLLAAGWIWHMARSVRVRRDLRFAWVQVGDLLEERFSLVNDSWLPVLWCRVNDHSNVPGYDANTVRGAAGRRTCRWYARGECRLRGEYHLGPWEAITSDPFGFFTSVQHSSDARTVLIYPPIAQRLPFALPRGAAMGWARTSHRSWEPTVSVGGVHIYVPGDPRRHIHWPTSARRDQLHVKEFDQETGGDIWLVLDLDRGAQVGQGERSTEEMGVIVAASASASLLEAGRSVGLITYGPNRRAVMPTRGRAHLWELLRVLALVRASEPRPLGPVLEEVARALPSGATALVVTPSFDAAWISGLARLQGRGIGTAVMLLDAASFTTPPPLTDSGELDWEEIRFSREAEALRGILAEVGVDTQLVHADMPLALRPPTGQVRRWEFKVLATGRALAVSTPWGVQG